MIWDSKLRASHIVPGSGSSVPADDPGVLTPSPAPRALKARSLLVASVAWSLAACSDIGCRGFESSETAFCIPSANALGSIWFLGRVSRNEIGFQLDPSLGEALITVTLTRRDYLCQIVSSEERERYCRPAKVRTLAGPPEHEVVRVQSGGYETSWTYEVPGAVGQQPLAHCSAIPSDPTVGRCITSGEYKDVVYSAIFLDSGPGGVVQVRTDVEEKLREWERPPSKAAL